MCTILLPIKPQYANRIMEKTKTYEYRKKKCKRNVDKILIYSTAPVKKIIGEVEVLDILINDPKSLWIMTRKYSGISQEHYKDYYYNSELAVAYKLGKVKAYNAPIELKELGINYYPQSYVYLD